jgi:hypothetical protein
MKVVAYDVSGKKYLTAGKEYRAFPNPYSPDESNLKNIVDDDGEVITIRISGCYHLNLKPWTIVEE